MHHMLLFECEGNFTEEHFNKGVNCYDRANMPFLKCKSSSIVAGWAVGAMVRTLIHFSLNRTFISICVDFMVLYYYMRNFCNLIGLEQCYFSLI